MKRKLTRGRKPHGRWEGRRWTTEMDARLETEEDDVLAREWGKTGGAVRVRRRGLTYPPHSITASDNQVRRMQNLAWRAPLGGRPESDGVAIDQQLRRGNRTLEERNDTVRSAVEVIRNSSQIRHHDQAQREGKQFPPPA